MTEHMCDWCDKPATATWRVGQDTGHSERFDACADHDQSDEYELARIADALYRL